MNWSGPSGVLAGALTLIVFEATVTSSANPASGASGIAGLLQYPGQLAAAWMSPTTALVPDLSAGKTAAPPPVAATAAQPPAQPPPTTHLSTLTQL